MNALRSPCAGLASIVGLNAFRPFPLRGVVVNTQKKRITMRIRHGDPSIEGDKAVRAARHDGLDSSLLESGLHAFGSGKRDVLLRGFLPGNAPAIMASMPSVDDDSVE